MVAAETGCGFFCLESALCSGGPRFGYYNGGILNSAGNSNVMQKCFQKKGSDPPVCGVHDVRLIETTVPIDSNAPHLGEITCLKCPVGDVIVLNDK